MAIVASSASASALGCAGETLPHCSRLATEAEQAAITELLGGDVRAAALVGRAYLVQIGLDDECTARFPWIDDVMSRASVEGPVSAASLDAVIAEDFRREDVLVVRGWVLARSEVALCVLATSMATP